MSIDTNNPHAMNKRLYAIDVALVGEDEAPKRWHRQFGSRKPWILCTPNGPNWDDIFQFRRAPYAPPLPSWDWHEAPDWASYLYTNSDSGLKAWGCIKPVPVYENDVIEPRPPQAWFDATADMTRAEYEALQRLARGEVVEPDSNEPADDSVHRTDDETAAAIDRAVLDYDGVLSGSKKLRAIAGAMDAGEMPSVFEFRNSPAYEWRREESDWREVMCANYIRRKPKTCRLIDANGVRHEWPEPMRDAPEMRSRYWAVFVDTYQSLSWGTDHPEDCHKWLAQRRCHATEEARNAHERALIAASTAGATDV